MDETNATPSTSSSSAAAVADSASAAASSKTATITTTTAAATTTTTTAVKLLIKASNQQFDDQIVESDLLWTVKRLKTQLSLFYPSKPPVAEQKLIYAGQLLKDTLQLKDVIRSYKDVYTQNHIFHLVYTPKYAPPAPNQTQKPKATTFSTPSLNAPAAMSTNINNATTTDGLRQRNVAGTAASAQTHQQQSQQQQQPLQQQMPLNYVHPQLVPQMLAGGVGVGGFGGIHCPQYDPNNPHNTMMPFSFPGQFNVQAMATQQAQMYNWMQQVYSQYMDQCVRLSNGAGITENMSTTAPTNVAAAAVPQSMVPNPFLQQLPFVAPNAVASPVIPAAFASGTLIAQAQAQAAPPAASADEIPPANGVAEQQQQQQQEAAAPPRFPNFVQDELLEHRDWLDIFFSITRLAIFLTILYFNSSPIRCLFVILIAGGIYLYHIGVFRIRHERNNNNINRNNNAAADQIRQGVEQVQAAQQQQQEQQQQELENAPVGAEDAVAANEADPLLASGDATPTNGDAAAGDENTLAADTAAAVLDGAAAEADNNSTSVISFVRTFVVTFFTSLLPETPAL